MLAWGIAPGIRLSGEPSAESAIQPGGSFGPLHGTGAASESRYQR